MKALRIKQVIEKTGLGRSSIYALLAKGMFPKQTLLAARVAVWAEEEVDGWLRDRFSSRSAC
ncbi:AlpA family phage regulatory protein [Thauera sp. CAU 1555]|uniref:AlpA family phage regulatory protein n=1 Tax=Thauera sedimentorum TaxID=2767595 RepID=A0ABR9B5S9_9RHOO|nr:AlpA family phage regulatory protein [Thauera sedimentorum]MBD8501733.1 AlpA family phage regulatory protein [Thauera sedimentorum]